MKTSETPFKVTVECRSPEAAKEAANRLKCLTKNVRDVVVEIVGVVIYMTFLGIGSSLSILGSIKDLLGMSYTASIAPNI